MSVGVLAYFAIGLRHGASDPLFFKGGYTFVALATAVLIYRVVYEPAGLLVKVLSTRPLVWSGGCRTPSTCGTSPCATSSSPTWAPCRGPARR